MSFHEHVMNRMDSTGHTKVTWDPKNQDEVKTARETFVEMLRKGYRAFRIKRVQEEKEGEQITEFDPEAREILLVPQLRGG